MIPFVDLKQDYQSISRELEIKIREVLDKGYFVLGEEVKKFEEDFANYIGTRYAVSVNSGSDAIFLAIKSLGIAKNDEIITVSHTFIATVDAIVRNDAKPVFVDIDPHHYCIDVSKIEERISERTKAILPVHLYGHPADLNPIRRLADKYGLFLIEDACQAHGAEYNHFKVGSMGDLGCFSFYPTKNLGSYGDGGIIVTDDEKLANKLKMLRNYGQSEKYHHEFVGINSRLDEMQAAILRIKMRYLDKLNKKRRKIAEIYHDHLKDSNLILPTENQNSKHVYYAYVVRLNNRDHMKKELLKKGIQTQIHYPVPVHKQNAYSSLNNSDLPITNQVCKEILSLPMHPWLNYENISQISRCVGEING